MMKFKSAEHPCNLIVKRPMAELILRCASHIYTAIKNKSTSILLQLGYNEILFQIISLFKEIQKEVWSLFINKDNVFFYKKPLWKPYSHSLPKNTIKFTILSQPVAEVLVYLHVQISLVPVAHRLPRTRWKWHTNGKATQCNSLE